MKKDRSRGWSMNTNGKVLITLIVAILAIKGVAQNWGEPYARQVILEESRTVPENVRIRETVKGTNYVIIAIDDRKRIYDADDVPLGINVQRYLLVEDAWMQTVGKYCGDMLFDGDTLPFDRGGGALFSVAKYIKYKKIDYDEAGIQPKNKPLYECSELAARLEVQRTMHRYADTVIDKYCKNRSQRHKICDSLFCPIDSVFLYLSIPTEEVIPFKLVANDTCLIEEESFRSDGRGLYLPDNIWHTLFHPIDTTLKSSQKIPIERVQIIPEGHVPSFIKTLSLEVQPDALVDYSAKPNLQIHNDEGKNHIAIIVIAVIAVLALAGFIVWRFFLKPKSKKDDYVENWADLKRELPPDSPSDSLDVINRIKEQDRIIDRLNDDIGWLRKEKEYLKKELDNWERQTGYKEPEKAKKDIEDIKKVKNDPKSFKGDKEFDKLSKLIVDAEEGGKVRDKMNNDPKEIEKDSPTGILVRKGRIFDKYVEISDEVFKRGDDGSITEAILKSPIAIQVKKGAFLDKAKDDVKLIRKDEEGWIGDSELKQFIEYIVNPDEILRSKRTNTGLYKLMYDINNIIAPNAIAHNTIGLGDLKYNWLKDRLIKVIEGYNKYLETEMVASRYGSDHFDTSCLEPIVRHVYDDASRYLVLMSYKNYWANIIEPLYDVLDNLQNHDDAFNTRALMFYASQFYSMSCIMNSMYGDMRFPTRRAKLNVNLFNTDGAPALSPWGFPILDYASLISCRYEITYRVGEDAKVKYLSQFKPLPFIFISSYYDDNILS